MKRILVVTTEVLGILIFMILFCFRTVLAISNGEIDGDRHPNVGALCVEVEVEDTIIRFLRCSGVLIDPNIFLTSGHCFISAELIQSYTFLVTFDSQFDPNGEFIEVKEVFFHPDFDYKRGIRNDIAVAILPEGSTEGIEPAKLPRLNQLDKMFEKCGLWDSDFINVGYGPEPEWKMGPMRFLPRDDYRRTSTSPFIALTKSCLFILMNNDATGQGGVCCGDSGGPQFLAEKPELVVAIIGNGDNVCRAISSNYRLDSPTARSFLSQFVSLP